MKHYPTYGQSVVLLIIWLLCTLVSALVAMPLFGMESGLGLSIAYALSMVLTVAAGLFLRGSWRPATNAFPWPILLWGTLLTIGSHVVLDPLTSVVPMSDTLMKLLEGMRSQPIPYFMMAVVAAPLLEEIMFRGIILDGYLKNYRPWQGILVSALLFGVIHGNLPQGIGAFVLGVFYGWFYWKTNSILPVIFLHLINNAIAFFATVSADQDDLNKSLRDMMANDTRYFLLYAGSVALCIGLVWLLQTKYFAKISPPAPAIQDTDTTA